jgi:predicted nuclease of predicted toxin-antitoxin system
MRFLVDAQLPPALARHLIEIGHLATHVAELGLERATDSQIRRHAVAHSAIIITKDEDFVVQRAFESAGPTIIWIRIGNTTKRELLTRVARAWPAIFAALERGETVIEVT